MDAFAFFQSHLYQSSPPVSLGPSVEMLLDTVGLFYVWGTLLAASVPTAINIRTTRDACRLGGITPRCTGKCFASWSTTCIAFLFTESVSQFSLVAKTYQPYTITGSLFEARAHLGHSQGNRSKKSGNDKRLHFESYVEETYQGLKSVEFITLEVFELNVALENCL